MNNKINYLDRFIDKLNKCNSQYEYIDGYKNDNSKVLLRCKKCNDIIERWASSVRSGKKFRCFNCERIVRRNKELEKERQKQNKIIDKQLDSIQLSFLVCQQCGKIYLPIKNQSKFCSKKCYRKYYDALKTYQHEQKRKELIKKNGNADYTITLDKLIKRDNNICYICNKECNINDYTFVSNTKVAGNYYPSIDHVIPLAKGGTHSWDNVRLAHRICNSLKSDKKCF